MFERWKISLPITEKMPVGVRWPAMPVDTGECWTGWPISKRVSCCLEIDTSISGISSGLGGGGFFGCSRLAWCDFGATAASAAPSAAKITARAAPLASAARNPALTNVARRLRGERSVSLQSISRPRAEITIARRYGENYLTAMNYTTGPAKVRRFFCDYS